MASHAGRATVSLVTLTTHDTHDAQVRALDARHTQLERRVEHHDAAIRDADGHDPSLGRELDAASSLLAQVRAELALLRDDDPEARS